MGTPKKLRFWVWWNRGPVRITVYDGKPVHLYKSGRTDEGYSYEEAKYWKEGNRIFCVEETGGRDCDGQISDTSRFACSRKNLAIRNPAIWDEKEKPMFNGVKFPEWEKVSSRRYDQYAEMAGY